MKMDNENFRRPRESFHAIFQNLQDFGIFTVDSDGRIASWNAGAKEIFGYAEEEIVGRPLATIFTEQDTIDGAPEQELETARQHGRADDERWHRRKGGELFWASGILSAVLDDGKVMGFVKVARDLTERKRAEEQRDRLLRDLERDKSAEGPFSSYAVSRTAHAARAYPGLDQLNAEWPTQA